MYTKNSKGQLRHPEGRMTVVTTPDVVALCRTIDSSLSTSSAIVLDKQTTMLRVYAISKDVYLKWGFVAVTAANFDEVIPAGKILDFKVPNGRTAIRLIEREASATVIVIEK